MRAFIYKDSTDDGTPSYFLLILKLKHCYFSFDQFRMISLGLQSDFVMFVFAFVVFVYKMITNDYIEIMSIFVSFSYIHMEKIFLKYE